MKKILPLLLVLILAGTIITPLFGPGFFPMHDDAQPTRIFEMAKALKDGMFPVRWAHDLGFGYGYPIFNFYSPLPYYIGAFFTFVGFDALVATKILFGLAVIMAGVGMYLFSRSFLGEIAGVTAAAIYLFFPYFAVNIFVRGAVGEFFAYAFLPYVFWGFFSLYYKSKDNPLKWIALASLSLASLIISHNLSAYMVSLALVLFFIIVFLFAKQKKTLALRYGFALLFVFLLSAFYTLPVFFEMKYTNVASQLTAGFKYSLNFVCPIQLWDSPWGFGGSAPGCLDGISYRLGKSNIIFALFATLWGAYFIFKKKKMKYTALFSFAVFLALFSIIMTTSYSQMFWEVLPNISYIQFPWRFLNYTGFALAILGGFLIFFGEKKHKLVAYAGACVIIVITLLINQKLFTPQFYDDLTVAYYTDKDQMTFDKSQLTNEYMPPGFIKPQKKTEVPHEPLEIVRGNGQITMHETTTGTLRASIQMQTEGEVIIKRAYFPAWTLFVDDKRVALEKTSTGMKFHLSKGNHVMLLRFTQTPIETIGNSISLAGVVLLFLGIIQYGRKKTKS